MKRLLREHAPFLVFFGGLSLYFLWPLVLLQRSFVLGDYGVQHYPWSFFYAQLLKQGSLPYWTNLVSGGFPLVSEGQFGPYYLLHQLFYRLLPFEGAYTWGIVFHFLLGGTGFYLYSRKIGLSRWSGALSAALFTFSSAYGGCFYNTVTQRVLTWLPWAMWTMECLRGAQGKHRIVRWALVLAVLISQMWTAGFPQMALYAVGYLGLLTLFVKKNRVRSFWAWLAASALAMPLALPQLASTVELARISTRAGEGADFALWGSALPFSFVSLVYPEWGNFLRVSFYIGILPLFLFLFELLSKRKPALSRAHLWLALLFFLLALGKYNPLYAAAVKTFSLTALRNPAKFLFFATVSMAVASGFGMERWLKVSDGHPERWPFHKIAAVSGAVMMVLPLAAWGFMKLTYAYWETKIPVMAEAIYSGKSDPSRSPEAYVGVLGDMLVRTQTLFAPDNRHQWVTIFFILASAALVWAAKKARPAAALTLVSLNLVVFAHFFGTGFLGNIAPADPFKFGSKAASLKKILHANETIAEREGLRDEEWFEPSSNLFYGLPHAGGYTPLLVKRHYELTRELGFVDSSLGRLPFSDETWRREKPLVDFLGVGLLVSKKPFGNSGWYLAGEVDGRALYQNRSALPPLYGVGRAKVIADRAERLAYLKSDAFGPRAEAILDSPIVLSGAPNFTTPRSIEKIPNGLSASIDMLSEGLLVSRIVDIPGIRVTIDGAPVPVVRVNHAFCGALLSSGTHQVRIFYDPSREHFWEKIALVIWGAAGVLFLLLSLPRPHK